MWLMDLKILCVEGSVSSKHVYVEQLSTVESEHKSTSSGRFSQVGHEKFKKHFF